MAHNTVLGTFWQVVRIAGQALWVIVMARSLGPSGYGTFAGIAGLATTLGGLVGLGTGYLLLQNVSRNPSTFGTHWLQAKLTTLFSGIVLVPLFAGLAYLVVKQHAVINVIVAIGVSELVCYPLVYVAGFAFQAHERMGQAGLVTAIMSGLRLLAIVVFLFAAPTRDLASYVWFHLAASISGALIALSIVHASLRPARARFSLRTKEVREGLSFSAVWFTGNAVTELDKTLALRLAGSELAGIYSVAYRMINALTLPVASLAQAAQPRLFRQATDRTAGGGLLVRHLVLVALVYGLAVSVVVWLCAGLLPLLLGQAFVHAAEAARLLIFLPPLVALRQIGNTLLMTSGRQLLRVLIELPGILLLIALATILIPRYGIAGIALTVSITEAALAACVWTSLWHAGRNHRPMR